ncbi:MAG TPA: hypothetical protein VF594_05650, partial [Rubricoccaceae bacterium]
MLVSGLVILAGCASTRQPEPGTLTAGVPDGDWLVTVRIPSFNAAGRTVEIPMVMSMAADGNRFEGDSPSAVLADVAGGGRNVLLARLLRPSAVRGGGVIHLVGGRAEGRRLSGTLVIPRVAAPTFDAAIRDGRMEGTLTWRGRPYGTLTGIPHVGTAPLRDYRAVLQSVEDTLATRFYRPDLLQTPTWQGFFDDTRDRMGRVRDDADALLAFNTLSARVNTSHFVLDAREAAEPSPATVSGTAQPAALSLSTPRSGVALLTARGFPVRLTADSVRAVMEQVVASGAHTLVVDLRGNRGGWFVSLAIASHLLDRDAPAGVELGRGWWTQHTAFPTASEAAALPNLSSYDLGA